MRLITIFDQGYVWRPCLAGERSPFEQRITTSEARVYRLRFKRQDGEDRLMHTPERLLPIEALQRFYAQREFTSGER